MKSRLQANFLVMLLALSAFAGMVQAQESEWQFGYTSEGASPLRRDLEQLEDHLRDHPEVVAELKRNGVIRIVIDKARDDADKTTKVDVRKEVEAILARIGVKKKIQTIVIKVDLKKLKEDALAEVAEEFKDPSLSQNQIEALQNLPVDEAAPPESRVKTGVKKIFRTLFMPAAKVVWWPFKQLGYAGSTLASSYAKPTPEEISVGVASKAYPFGLSVMNALNSYSESPIAMGSAIGLSLALDTFHGVWVSTWLNFQNRIQIEKGKAFQVIFNYAYGQFWGMMFRTISYLSGTTQNSAVSTEFLIISNSTGAITQFSSSFAYQGLNRLLATGTYSYRKRAFIQQFLRDTPYMIEQLQLYVGTPSSMIAFWALWTYNQTQSLYFYLRGQLAPHRPSITIGPSQVLESKEFKEMFFDLNSEEPLQTPWRVKISNAWSACARLFSR
jgi:hypothetical protein